MPTWKSRGIGLILKTGFMSHEVLLITHESEKASKAAMINNYILQSCVFFKLPKG